MIWKAVTLLLVQLFCLQCTFGETEISSTLRKRYVNNTEAICNDNSRATFFIGPVQSSNKWVVFFESGGFCSSFDGCNKRYMNVPVRNEDTTNSIALMTSTLLPDEVTGRDILSASKNKNLVFYEYTHVLVPYCSSDLWLGQKTNPNKPFHFVNDSSVDNFSFRGHTIFRSVFLDLLQRYNLSKAIEIVLAGSSAGGIGVLNHADWVLNHVIKSHGLKAKLKSIIDSGWFINFQDSLQSSVRPRFMSFVNILSSACQDLSRGYPCCSSASCMIARGYYPAGVPLLIVSSMYDIFLFGDVLERQEKEGRTVKDNSADYLSLVSMYGGAMNESISLTTGKQALNISVFSPACFQHIYFCTSSLWDEGGVFPPSAEVSRGTGKFSHKVQSGTWESTKIQTKANSTSIKDFIATWIWSRGSPMTLIDSCIGAQCNPTCPGQLLFIDPGAVWGQTLETTILAASLVITVVSLVLKVIFLLHYYYLVRKQKQYLDKTACSPMAKELPLCSPLDMISIACLNLSYSVHVTEQREIRKEKGNKEPMKLSNEAVTATDGENEDPPCSGALEPMPLPGDNLGFDTTAEGGLVISLHDRMIQSPARLSNNSDVGVSEKGNGESSGKEKGNYFLHHRRTSSNANYAEMEENNPRKKKVLKNISVYFNPGELVAIMGPSGCGKTTLLDLLTGRRTHGHSKGHVYVNGVSLDRVQDWYARRIGYVLQLAVPYYEELTVRQNLVFAAHMRLPKKMSHKRKFERVEQILAEGLTSLADVIVGASVGAGLSGGQKRRLCVALQMINLPSVIFLDEPTSGLDASSSLELLNHLNLVAESGRLVILTIHQPRLEIFHLFHKILLLCNGEVAYYGEPAMAPSVFLEAYLQSTTEEFRLSEDAPKIDAKNPADTLMDLLNCSEARRAVLDYYQTSGEPQAVQEAVMMSQRQQARNRDTMPNLRFRKKSADGGGVFNRIFVLEARTSERQTLGQMLYFPLIFLGFGVITGTVYYRAEEKDGILLMSAFCVYCCASPLFLSSVLMAHLNKALDIFRLERADGCGHSHENVIQTYVRTTAVCLLPVVVCSVMSYFLVLTSYDLWKFVLVTIISLVLNQTWIAVYMMVICAQPRIAHRICPMVSAIGGFAGGFLVPRPAMPDGYNLLFYINPQFYGYSAITKVLLKNVRLKCEYESALTCISTDGNAVLARFGFDEVNIYEHLAIMLGMTVFSLLLAWLFLELKYINMNIFTKSTTFSKDDEGLETPTERLPENRRRTSTLKIISEYDGLHTVKVQGCSAGRRERSSTRRERWQSTRKRMQERKTNLQQQQDMVTTVSARNPRRPQGQSQASFKESALVEHLEPEQSESGRGNEQSNSDLASENTSEEQMKVLRIAEIKPTTERKQKYGLRFKDVETKKSQELNGIQETQF